MIYFDNAATGGKKPDSVLSAVAASLRNPANPGRSGHKLSLACAYIVQNARCALSDFFGGYGYERVTFTKNCTEALNIAIFSALSGGGHAVTTCMEHNSVLRPLEHLKRLKVADYSVATLTDGNISPESILPLLREDTKAVIVTGASNVTGAMPDLAAIKRALPPDVLLICDGAQACGHIPISLKGMGLDALCVAGHKGMHAIQGAGALLFSERFSPQPILFGGTGSESFNLGMPPFYPDQLESGTLNFPAISSLFEGVLYARLKASEDGKYIEELTALLIDGLRANGKVIVYSSPNPCGIVSFAHKEMQSEEVATLLSEKYSIAVRGGLHCAPLMHRALGTAENGLVRASLSAFSTKEEVSALLKAMRRM
jgi:selenocysteine lyase/cysteine desulfurase